FLKAWFRSRRFAGSKDRRAIAELVFSVTRRRAHLAHRMANHTPRARVIAWLLEEGQDIDSLFGGGYGPAPLTPDERTAIATHPLPAPDWVRGEYPRWLEPELARAFGDRLLVEMTEFITRAPTDIRVNTLKTNREALIAGLAGEGLPAAPTPFAPL